MSIMIGSACTSPTPSLDINPTDATTALVSPSQITAPHIITQPPTATVYPSPSAEPSSTASPLPSPTPAPTHTLTPSATPTQFSTPAVTPTYSILRGTVKEQSNCRYGPGAAYLYKYGLYPGNTLDVIGRNATGTWIVVQAIGGSNPCWLKAALMDIKGDVMSLAPASLPLPQSPYYGPLTGVISNRAGSAVTISWNPLNLRAGDDSLQNPYLIEAWLCQGGQITFAPIGTWDTTYTVQDEPGCLESSHARVYGVEKHGYTKWVTIPWTQP